MIKADSKIFLSNISIQLSLCRMLFIQLTSSNRAVSSVPEFEDDDPEATDVVKRLQWISSVLELTLTDRHFKNQVFIIKIFLTRIFINHSVSIFNSG